MRNTRVPCSVASSHARFLCATAGEQLPTPEAVATETISEEVRKQLEKPGEPCLPGPLFSLGPQGDLKRAGLACWPLTLRRGSKSRTRAAA